MTPLRPIPKQHIRYATSNVTYVPLDSIMANLVQQQSGNVSRYNKSTSISSNTYEADLRRGDLILGIDPLFTENTLKNVEVIPYVPYVKKTKVESTDIVSKAVVDLKIKSGKVSVTISCPIENLYTKYYSKGMKPPLKERILAYSKIGYTNQQLAKMIKNDDDYKKTSIENDKFIETIFGDASKKKTTAAPKKKTLLQIIGYKKSKYATNDDFGEAGE